MPVRSTERCQTQRHESSAVAVRGAVSEARTAGSSVGHALLLGTGAHLFVRIVAGAIVRCGLGS
jgi:hypothetical protein